MKKASPAEMPQSSAAPHPPRSPHRVAERAEQEARRRECDDEAVVPAERLEEMSFLDNRFSHGQPPGERSRRRLPREGPITPSPLRIQSGPGSGVARAAYALSYNPSVASPAPPITITCECGGEVAVPYGERWTCPDCGRTWNTAQIPEAEYARRNRQMNRYRIEILVCAALLLSSSRRSSSSCRAATSSSRIIVVLAWMFFYIPFWRRRVRRAAANAPRWELTPE